MMLSKTFYNQISGDNCISRFVLLGSDCCYGVGSRVAEHLPDNVFLAYFFPI